MLGGTDDVLDILLDQEGLEIDHLDRLEGDTPLHKAVRYVNDLAGTDWQGAQVIVDILLDAGCDPKYTSPFLNPVCPELEKGLFITGNGELRRVIA